MAYFSGNFSLGINNTINENIVDNTNFTNAVIAHSGQTNIWQSFMANSSGIINSVQLKGSSLNYIDQDDTAGGTAGDLQTSPYWQSFTAGITGNLSAIYVFAFSSTGISFSCPFNIYAGIGTNGTLLFSTTTTIPLLANPVCLTTFLYGQFPIISGNIYTFQLTPVGNTITIAFAKDSYSGGESSDITSFAFTTFMYNPIITNLYSGTGISGALLSSISQNVAYNTTTSNPTFALSSTT